MAGSSLAKEDEPGFDPFAEPDTFREDYPAHEPVAIGSLLGRLASEPVGQPPPPMQVKCGRCFRSFRAKACWGFSKWRYSALCADCADGNTLPEGFLNESERPPIRQLICLQCGLRRGIDPVLRYNLWHYEASCGNCGQDLLAIYRIKRVCKQCEKEFHVNERRPKRTCNKCSEHATAF